MSLETILILSAILNVVTLICYFVLCFNVSVIKKRMKYYGASQSTAFSVYISLGMYEKAKEILVEMILSDDDVRHSLTTNIESLQNVMGKYFRMLKLVDMTFDAEKAFNTKQLF